MWTPSLVAAFVRDRDAALLSLDEAKIRALSKYGLRLDLAPDHDTFWGGVHKARAALTTMPEAVRAESRAWLEAHGMSPITGEVR